MGHDVEAAGLVAARRLGSADPSEHPLPPGRLAGRDGAGTVPARFARVQVDELLRGGGGAAPRASLGRGRGALHGRRPLRRGSLDRPRRVERRTARRPGAGRPPLRHRRGVSRRGGGAKRPGPGRAPLRGDPPRIADDGRPAPLPRRGRMQPAAGDAPGLRGVPASGSGRMPHCRKGSRLSRREARYGHEESASDPRCVPRRSLHRFPRLHRSPAHSEAAGAEARQRLPLPRAGEVPRPGTKLRGAARRDAPRNEGADRARHRRHHGPRPRDRGDGGPRPAPEADRLLPPRGRVRPRREARRGDADQRRGNAERPRLPRGVPPPEPVRLRLDGVRLRDGGRHVSRDGSRRRAVVQELLRGDEVPRRGGREGERASDRDLPPGDRRRRLPDGGDGEVRRPLLRAERDETAPVARRLREGRPGNGPGEPRPDRLRPRGDGSSLDLGRGDREDLPPDRPESPFRLRDRGALRQGHRQAVPLRPGADRPRQAPLLAEAGPGLLRHARRDGGVLRPPGAVRQLARGRGPRAVRRLVSRPSSTTSRTSSRSIASTSRRSRGGR